MGPPRADHIVTPSQMPVNAHIATLSPARANPCRVFRMSCCALAYLTGVPAASFDAEVLLHNDPYPRPSLPCVARALFRPPSRPFRAMWFLPCLIWFFRPSRSLFFQPRAFAVCFPAFSMSELSAVCVAAPPYLSAPCRLPNFSGRDAILLRQPTLRLQCGPPLASFSGCSFHPSAFERLPRANSSTCAPVSLLNE